MTSLANGGGTDTTEAAAPEADQGCGSGVITELDIGEGGGTTQALQPEEVGDKPEGDNARAGRLAAEAAAEEEERKRRVAEAEAEALAEADRARTTEAEAAEREEREVRVLVSELFVLYVEPGVGHTETAGMNRAVRQFLCQHLLRIPGGGGASPSTGLSTTVRRHAVDLS